MSPACAGAWKKVISEKLELISVDILRTCPSFLTLLLASGFLLQTLTPASSAFSDDSPDPAKIVSDAFNFIGGQKKFSVVMETDLDMSSGGVRQEIKSVSNIFFERPDKLLYEAKGAPCQITLVCDGKRVSVRDITNNLSYDDAMPEKLEEYPFEEGKDHGFSLLRVLISKDPSSRIMQDIESVSYVGQESLDGAECHVVKMTEKDISWKIWVKTTVPLLAMIAPEAQIIAPDEYDPLSDRTYASDPTKLSFEMRFKNWNFNPEFADGFFSADMKQAEAEAVVPVAKVLPNQKPEKKLLDSQAPELCLATLSPAPFKLSDHIGKSVVILGFWNSFHQGASGGIPVLEDLIKAYPEDKLVVCSINHGDSEAKIKQIVEKNKMSCTLAIDPAMSSAGDYFTTIYPQIVVIGLDGKVRSVYSGGKNSDVKEKLCGELDSLIGKKNN